MTLATRYLGLQLAHPIVASASPLTATLDGMRRLEDAGAAAVVMASLYEEQIRAEDKAYALVHGARVVQPGRGGLVFSRAARLRRRRLGSSRDAATGVGVSRIPVIASLNGTTAEGWVEHARSLEQAGAAAIELNIYSIPIDLAVSGAEIEQRYIDIVRERAGDRPHSDLREAGALFHRRCRTWRRGWCAPASTASCSSIASMRRTSISRRFA